MTRISGGRIARILLGLLALTVVGGGAIVYIAVNTNHGGGAQTGSGLSAASRAELGRLPYCEVARRFDTSAEVIAGVVLAEKQLNRDWSDSVQDALFNLALLIRSEEGWRVWAQTAQAASQAALADRVRTADWSSDVVWSGYVFSLGPAQVTPRTVFRACANAAQAPSWCAHPQRVIRAILDETHSIEAAALILRDERENHRKITGVDVGGAPGRWATLYNFGGDIFRARFSDRPDREANAFGKWVDRNAAEIRATLACT